MDSGCGSLQFTRSVVSNSAAGCSPWGWKVGQDWATELDSSTPDFPVHHQSGSLLELMSITLVMPSNHLILCRPLLPPSIFPSIRIFSNESVLRIRWPKYWSFSFNISPSSEHPGLISLRRDWLDLLAVQGTLKRLIHHHSSKASILQCSAFLESNSHIHTWPLEKPQPWLDGPLLTK